MKFAFTQNSMSHKCICDKTTTILCIQTVGICHTCQEIGAKPCNLDMYNTFFGQYKWFLVHLAVSVMIYVISINFKFH